MAGRPKHAQFLTDHLDEPIDAACMITRPGATATMAIGGLVGEAAGATMARRAKRENAIKFDRNGWLALGPDAFTLVYGDSVRGRPKGDPIARITYTCVAEIGLTPAWFTTRADMFLSDGRTLAFEAARRGANKRNLDVLKLLAARCTTMHAVAVR